MTREEAAEILDGRNIVGRAAYLEALEVAANALCTRTAYMKELDEAPTKLDRSRWKGCNYCNKYGFGNTRPDFCYGCGKPQNEKAWAELERRIGGNDGN